MSWGGLKSYESKGIRKEFDLRELLRVLLSSYIFFLSTDLDFSEEEEKEKMTQGMSEELVNMDTTDNAAMVADHEFREVQHQHSSQEIIHFPEANEEYRAYTVCFLLYLFIIIVCIYVHHKPFMNGIYICI